MRTAFLVACISLVCAAHLNYSFPLSIDSTRDSLPGVRLHTEDPRHVVIDNGIVQVIVGVPEGFVTGVKYGGIDNLLEIHNKENNRGYWDVVWYRPGEPDNSDWLWGTSYRVIMQNEEQVELSFTRTWQPTSQGNIAPLNVDRRIIVRRGSSGFYLYTILERLEGWPDVDMDQIRIVFKLQNDKFHYMAISDEIQRVMPTLQDREAGEPLAYKEAVLITNSSNPQVRGEVDDKYMYSMENQDIKVHGWIAEDPGVGFWMIKPSNEFCAGGPNKQELTAHVGPTVLATFTSVHYTGKDLNTQYRNGEPWKKVLGPVFVYLNSISTVRQMYSNSPENGYQMLWRDAKNQMDKEVNSWPYSFPQSVDFPSSDKRGSVSGKLLIRDGDAKRIPASFAYVGVASPGDPGSWQYDSKGYQFWTKADQQGSFFIKNVRPGLYNLYAWAPGFIGDYKHGGILTIGPGGQIDLGVITYSPPRNGPTLWEIGIADRSAAEFFVPTPDPHWINRLYLKQPNNRYRQYGLWERYSQLYQSRDLVYRVGVNDYRKDWFFAHVVRDSGDKVSLPTSFFSDYILDKVVLPTTWQIIFGLQNVNAFGNYTLQLAFAAATMAELEVRFNDPSVHPPHFSTRLIGKDNAIARHGIHGLYRLYSLDVPGRQLVKGNNIIYLSQTRAHTTWEGVLYDYIRLEGPS